MFASNFTEIIKDLLKDLPRNDYPVLNSFLFVSCWIGWILDQSRSSMRDLFLRLNNRNIPIDISTFSKANKKRNFKIFEKILNKAIGKLMKNIGKSENQILFPLDSTIVPLTSKLLWRKDIIK